MATTKTVKCPRCTGSGTVCGGWCFLCKGATVHTYTVYTAAEKADMKKRFQRRQDALAIVQEHAPKLDAHLGLRSGWDELYADWAFWGFTRLEEDPERFDKMLDSLKAGRIYDVIRALADYSQAHAIVEQEA